MLVRMTVALFAAILMIAATGCDRRVVGGAAVGTVGAGAAYEYQGKRAMDSLEQEYRAGQISQEEYERRKREIESRYLLQ